MAGISEIESAAALILGGGLVAFPTETVYGLGANALDAAAVARIFEVKGRPATSPLIVHVASVDMARGLVTHWPPEAEILATRFWPGPLTLVLEKRPAIPDIVTAGLATVGLRVPANATALALIHAAGVPIAAPSANLFTQLSPTSAHHVRSSLGDRVDFILDGGRTNVGIESTVLSLAGGNPVLLRPGMVSRGEIEEAIGPVALGPDAGDGPHASPGLHPRHYSPRTPLLLVAPGNLPGSGDGAYLWLSCPAEAAMLMHMPPRPADYAALLYRVLHDLDGEGWDWIAVEEPPAGDAWDAVRDRLRRASGGGPEQRSGA